MKCRRNARVDEVAEDRAVRAASWCSLLPPVSREHLSLKLVQTEVRHDQGLRSVSSRASEGESRDHFLVARGIILVACRPKPTAARISSGGASLSQSISLCVRRSA